MPAIPHELREALERAVLDAIKEVGEQTFRRTSFFGSNQRHDMSLKQAA